MINHSLVARAAACQCGICEACLYADVAKVLAIIEQQPPAAQRRIEVVANILRDLINAQEAGDEVEIAFTLVLAERAAL